MSYDFERSNSNYGLVTSSSAYPNAFGWSVAVWFRVESFNTDQRIFGMHSASDGNIGFHFTTDGTNAAKVQRSQPGDSFSITHSATLSTGTWYLAVYAETSRTSRKFWIGSTESTTNSTDIFDWSNSTYNLTRMGFGCRPSRTEDGGPASFYDGMLAEVGIWPTSILDQTDVNSLAGGAALSTVKGGPSPYWSFHTDKGTTEYTADVGTGLISFTGGTVGYSGEHPTITGSSKAPQVTAYSRFMRSV